MDYPIITPEFFNDLAIKSSADEPDVVYNTLMTPAAVEYAFPLYQEKVVRKLISLKEPLRFKMTKLKPEDEAEYSKTGQALIDENPVLENYWNIKGVTMHILQDRRYSIEKRMLILNFVYKNIQVMLDKSKDEYIPQFIHEFTHQQNHDDIIEYFKEIKPNLAYSLCDGLSFIAFMPSTEAFDKVRAAVCKAVNVAPEMKEFKFDENVYLPVKKSFHVDFLKDKEAYLENVMINYVWTHCMPYSDFSFPLWENFIFFNILFNSIKILLTCYLYGRDDKDEAFVEAITAFDESFRKFEGNIVARVIAANAKEGLSNNGDMAVLSLS